MNKFILLINNYTKTQIGFFVFILFQIFCTILLVTDYDISSTKYLTRLVGLLFIFLTFSGLLYWVGFLIGKKKKILIPAAVSLTITNIVCYFSLYKEHVFHDYHVWFSEFIILNVIPMRFMEVSVRSGDLIWGIALAGYIGLGMIIYGYFFIKNKNGFENKYEKQVMYLGGGTYLFLFPLIFVFTHFTFVGSNYQYIHSMIKYTDSAVQVYDKQGKTDYFDIKELKWFPNMHSAYNYLSSEAYKATLTGTNNKKDFYDTSMSKFADIMDKGWYDKPKVSYETMKEFNHWVAVSYNFNMDAVNKETKTAWYSELGNVLTNTAQNEQDLLRHSIFYIHELDDGSVYLLLDFNRTFKDHKINYIFNLFFVLYHIIYLSRFAYLVYIHNNKHKKGKKLN